MENSRNDSSHMGDGWKSMGLDLSGGFHNCFSNALEMLLHTLNE